MISRNSSTPPHLKTARTSSTRRNVLKTIRGQPRRHTDPSEVLLRQQPSSDATRRNADVVDAADSAGDARRYGPDDAGEQRRLPPSDEAVLSVHKFRRKKKKLYDVLWSGELMA